MIFVPLRLTVIQIRMLVGRIPKDYKALAKIEEVKGSTAETRTGPFEILDTAAPQTKPLVICSALAPTEKTLKPSEQPPDKAALSLIHIAQY